MYYRRARRSSTNSYMRTCRRCGERIHMREMPHGQWVPFSGYDRVHRCGESSEYGPWQGTTRPHGDHPRFSVPPREYAKPPKQPKVSWVGKVLEWVPFQGWYIIGLFLMFLFLALKK